MATNGSAFTKIQVNKSLLAAGGVLAVFGSFLVLIGLLLGGISVFSAFRQWVRAMDRPPSETAKIRFQQLRVAASAGAKAFREGAPGD
jgi:hypothetical protein